MWSLSNIPSLCELGSVLFSIQRRPTGILPPGVANDDDDGGGLGAKENCFLVEKGQQLRRVLIINSYRSPLGWSTQDFRLGGPIVG